MAKINLTFDVEEQEEGDLFKKSYNGALKIIAVLAKHKIKAVFFVTAVFAKKYPKLIKKIAERHELGCHGYKHTEHYEKMPPELALKKLKSARELLEKISGKKVKSFRAPRMLPPNLSVIKAAGFNYDYSLHPTWVPGRYFNLFASRFVHEKNGVKIIPATVTPIFRLPLSWFWFNLYPLWLAKALTKFSLVDQNVITVYFHSWEFSNEKKLKKLDKYIDFLEKLI